jgi:RNA polymerase sigma-70 factor (ECF subfamily)
MNTNKIDEKVQPQTILTLDDDFSLIHRFNKGDEYAFKTLVQRHKEKVRNIIYLTLGNTDYIDDISQDVFISVFRKLNTFKFESQFTTWLYRITINKCKDHLRRIKVRSMFSFLGNDESNFDIPSSHPNDDFDVKEIIKETLAKLPEKLKIPLILKDYDGLSYQEIAETLNTEIGTVKSRIFRAREGMKKLLEPFEKELI